MTAKTNNRSIFASFQPMDNPEIANCLGLYGFHLLGLDAQGEITKVDLCGLWVRLDSPRVKFAPDGGDPPSARAGRALELHQTATAMVRAQAPELAAPVAIFINDAGEVEAVELYEFLSRVPTFAADLPSLVNPAALQVARTGCEAPAF